MDPSETLEVILRQAKHLYRGGYTKNDVQELAEACLNLDQWIMSGGCLPIPWAKARDEAHRRRRIRWP